MSDPYIPIRFRSAPDLLPIRFRSMSDPCSDPLPIRFRSGSDPVPIGSGPFPVWFWSGYGLVHVQIREMLRHHRSHHLQVGYSRDQISHRTLITIAPVAPLHRPRLLPIKLGYVKYNTVLSTYFVYLVTIIIYSYYTLSFGHCKPFIF